MFVILGPIGLIIALLVPSNENELNKQSGNMKTCPYCDEYVRKEAIICKHCGKALEENWKQIK